MTDNLRFLYLIPAALLSAAITAHFLVPAPAAERLADWCFATLAVLMLAEATYRTALGIRRRSAPPK